jgi:3-hydroxyisobutyrate dehydrogenase-like beta-hydroxyacid dehydrogenase
MKVGFIGLGTMGRGMAANLQKAGCELVVTDIVRDAATPFLEKGAVWADTPKAVAEASDVVFTSLPTPADVEAVGFGENGLASGFRKGAAWFDLSTNAVSTVRKLHAQCAAIGVDFLDAPISGGPAGAASGRLAIWVGGDKAVFDKYEPVLKAMADQARYIGTIGAGSVAKLVHNCTSAALSAVLAETFTMGIKAGVEPLALFEAVRHGVTGKQRVFDRLANNFLQGKYDPPAFAMRLVQKDQALGMQLAREVGVPMRIGNMVLQEIDEAMNRGWGQRDAVAYLLLQQERSGIEPVSIPLEAIQKVLAAG